MSDLEPVTSPPLPATPADALSDLELFEESVRATLSAAGLPAGQLFVSVDERRAMLTNVSSVLGGLDTEARARSFYISKMVAAGAVGLFDAALNYLWDELVSELRRRVVGFDLNYFFDIAAGNSAELRKALKSEQDLARIDDANLLRAALSIGLVTDVGYQRLDHIRYMRNHASAAHPNQVSLTGLDLANWLQICIREVINTPPDTVTANTGRLLTNIKKDVLDASAVNEASAFFDQLPQDRADTLANGLFGLYTDPQRSAIVADNVRILWPELWPFVGEESRSSYGLRQARASASAETDFATASRELIDLVGGTSYLAPEVRAVDLSDALDVLSAAHSGFNNFYAEPAPARRVADLAGEKGDVPAPVRTRYVRTVVECFLGNGYGVSTGAEPYYIEMMKRFSPNDAAIALRLFREPVFSSLLSSNSGRSQWTKLLDALEPKLTAEHDRELMAAVRTFNGNPDQLRLDTGIAKLAGGARK